MHKLKILTLVILLFTGCSASWQLKTHHGFLTPNVYELTDGNISIKYYNGQCCCVAKEVLTELKTRIETGQIDPARLKDKTFVEKTLQQLCNELKNNQEKIK